jgi:hypothetical protein
LEIVAIHPDSREAAPFPRKKLAGRSDDCRSRLLLSIWAGRNRHAIHLDVERPRPRRHVQKDASRRISREITRVDCVEFSEVRWIWRAINVAFDNLRKRRTGRFQTEPHLIKHKFDLPLEGDRLNVASFGIKGRQAGQIDKAVGNDHRIDRAFSAPFQIARYWLHAQPFHRISLPASMPSYHPTVPQTPMVRRRPNHCRLWRRLRGDRSPYVRGC